jgi:hypothetical protein
MREISCMSHLSISKAYEVVEGVKSAILDAERKRQAHSVVYVEALGCCVSMPSSDAPEEYGWEIITTVGYW